MMGPVNRTAVDSQRGRTFTYRWHLGSRVGEKIAPFTLINFQIYAHALIIHVDHDPNTIHTFDGRVELSSYIFILHINSIKIFE